MMHRTGGVGQQITTPERLMCENNLSMYMWYHVHLKKLMITSVSGRVIYFSMYIIVVKILFFISLIKKLSHAINLVSYWEH